MPRRLRIHVPGGFYHVTLRGNHRQNLFVEELDYRLLNAIVARALEKFEVRLHAYCWMSNHLHFLLQVSDIPLAGPMRQIAAEFARAMQRKLETTGHFFERRYHASLVDADSYLLELVRYVHLNPVRAGVVSSPDEYRWSSHHVYVGTRHEPWVTSEFVLGMFAGHRSAAIAAYREFVRSEESDSFQSRISEGIGLSGGEEFSAKQQRSSCVSMPHLSLHELIAEACRRFEVDIARLKSPVRDAYVAKVRAWIANQARTRGVASLASVARELGRDESTLREAMRRYTNEVE